MVPRSVRYSFRFTAGIIKTPAAMAFRGLCSGFRGPVIYPAQVSATSSGCLKVLGPGPPLLFRGKEPLHVFWNVGVDGPVYLLDQLGPLLSKQSHDPPEHHHVHGRLCQMGQGANPLNHP